MTTRAATRVFLARLAGTGVFDPNGDQVGKVRDAVIMLRSDAQPPRVLGLVVEVMPRRRIFVPMGRVTAIDPGQVIVTGTVNLRRFEQRSNETLIVGELLDRHVTLRRGGDRVTVIDAAIEASKTRDWHVTQLFVRKGGGFRRRGQSFVVDWDEVVGLSVVSPEQGTESLLATLDDLRPADLANVLHELSPKRRVEVARGLDDERLADVLEELPEDDQVEIIQMLEAERAADVLEEMDPGDAADLLSELSPEQAEDLLERIEPEDAEDLRRLLRYDDFSAGGMMTTDPIVLGPDATVAEALAAIRNPEIAPSLAAQIYVTRPPIETPTGKYLGVAHFQRLLREPPSTLVSAILDRDLEPIGPDAPLEQVTRYFATYNLVALPVVDEEDHLIGTITVDDVVDHMLPKDWRDEQEVTDE